MSLLLRVEELAARAADAVADGRWLDAALAAAGMLQATDDELAGTLSPVVAAAAKARRRADPVGRVVTTALDAATALARAPRAPRRRAAAAWREQVAELSLLTAGLALGSADAGAEERALAAHRRLGPPPPGIGRAVARIPSCFRAFDQHPDDVAAIVADFAGRWPDRSRPVLVVGVRTSGSYLAPFTAAALRQRGYGRVSVISERPDHRLLPADRTRLATAVRAGAVALVVDDPPTTGDSLARVCAGLVRAGLPPTSVVVGVALFGDAPPVALSRFATVTLPWGRWSIHRRLGPEQATRDLADALAPAAVELVEELPVAPGPARTHLTRLYRFRVRPLDGDPRLLTVLATGSGLGHFGRHDLAVASALAGRVPAVLGTGDGVIHLRWPDEPRPAAPTPAEVAEYVLARQRALPVAEDPTARLRGSQPVWEVASNHLGRAYGRYWPAARLVGVDRLARHLLRTPSPSVPDGDMRPGRWLAGPSADRPVKTGATERAFSNFDLVSLDHRVDVVGAAVHADDETYAAGLRAAYAAASGGPIPPEPWLLHELVQLWDLERQGLAAPETVRVRKTRAVRRYLAGRLLADVEPSRTGPVVALDVDGVLETDIWGFDAPTPATLTCLRALHVHGHRPVVVTGRSLDDVIELTELYGLAGGAAEYGSVRYDAASGAAVPIVDEAAVARLDRFRASVRERGDVVVDPRHRHSVRVSAVVAPGRLRGLAADALALPAGLVAVVGDRQTDVVAAGVDKATGARALLRVLGEERPALAVGDTAADVPMLRWAARSVVPAHADAAARAAACLTARRPYQSGLEDAVAGLLGHRPGGCRVCAPPPVPEDAALLLALLRVPEGSRAQALARTAPLLLRLARAGADAEQRR